MISERRLSRSWKTLDRVAVRVVVKADPVVDKDADRKDRIELPSPPRC